MQNRSFMNLLTECEYPDSQNIVGDRGRISLDQTKLGVNELAKYGLRVARNENVWDSESRKELRNLILPPPMQTPVP